MPRPPRADVAGELYRVLNRGNQPLSDQEEERLQRAITRRQPFGAPGLVESTAGKYNLEATLRKRGRPRTVTQTAK